MRLRGLLFAWGILLFGLLSSCGGGAFVDEPDEPIQPDTVPSDTVVPDTLCVLAIGNSFTVDAMAMLPFVMQQVYPDTYLVLGILYRGGTSLADHLAYVTNDWTYSQYYRWTVEEGWIQTRYKAPLEVLDEEPWDWITLQQVSYMSFDYSTVEPYLGPLVSFIRGRGYHGRMGWILTQSYPDGSSHLNGLKREGVAVNYTSDEMLMATAVCAQQVLNTGLVDAVFPCGTALQNARHTSLQQYGDWGQMTQESMHLQSGIGMFVEACAAAMTLKGTSFDQCRINVTTSMYRPLARGHQVGMSDDNQDLAVKCAAAAFHSPFAISTL